MAVNVVMCSFSIPVPGGHLYLNDVVICVAAIVLDPVSAFLTGGVGAFLGDLIFYPLPMFVSLVSHGLQAAAISLIAHYALKKHPGGGIGNRGRGRCCDHGDGLHAREDLCLQHV